MTRKDKKEYLINMFRFLFTDTPIIVTTITDGEFMDRSYMYREKDRNIELNSTEIQYLAICDILTYDSYVIHLTHYWEDKVVAEIYDNIPKLMDLYIMEKRDNIIDSL